MVSCKLKIKNTCKSRITYKSRMFLKSKNARFKGRDCTWLSLKSPYYIQDFEAYARGIEEQADIIREQVGEERMVLTNNQIALQEQHEQLKFEKHDLVRFNTISL